MSERAASFEKARCRKLLYTCLKVATVIYVTLQVVVFHLQLDDMPREVFLFWALTLFGYTFLKEVFRWARIPNGNSVKGEYYAGLVILSFSWMEAFSMVQHYCFGKPFMRLPGGYFESAREAFLLLIGSAASYAFYHRRNNCK